MGRGNTGAGVKARAGYQHAFFDQAPERFAACELRVSLDTSKLCSAWRGLARREHACCDLSADSRSDPRVLRRLCAWCC